MTKRIDKITGRQGRILIVDDEAAVRRLLHQRLAREGYWCEEVGNGDEVLDKIKSNPVELVILDIKMPGKSGVELLPEIEAEYPYHVITSILNLMFNPALQLSGAELVRQNILAMKLEQCKDDEIILEDEEWERIKKAFDAFKGFSRTDVELVTRINEAEVVEVKTK